MADKMFESNKVSDILDWIGFSHSEISWRIKSWKTVESINNVANRINGEPLKIYTGSRAEGVGVDEMGSDLDIMCDYQKRHVIFNFGDWQQLFDKLTLMVDTVDVHPGYCRLKLMNMHEPTFINVHHIPMPNGSVNYKGELVLHNDIKALPCYTRQGPAMTLQMSDISIDTVQCYQTYWPPGAREWIERERPSKYPPLYFIQEAERRGIHVVPTGYKGSEHQNLEWRFSFSITELDLVHMWPNAVFKCYVMLKLLKYVITRQLPHLSHTLGSYHLKTLLFWLTEETGLDYWNIPTLMKCLMFSLSVLLCWVERGCIPHYFMRTNNLFDMEAGTSRQSDLVTVLRVWVSDGPMVLKLYECYRNWCAEKNIIRPTHNLFPPSLERETIHWRFGACLIDQCTVIMSRLLSADIRKSIVHIKEAMRELRVSSTQCDHDASMGTGYIIGALKSICGTVLLSFLQKNLVSNTTHYILLKTSEEMLTGSTDNDFVQLKLANFYFQTRRYKRATKILHIMSEKNCGRYKHNLWESREYCSAAVVARMSRMESPFHFFCSSFASTLSFVVPEIHATPSALKFEMFKSDNPPCNLLEKIIYDRGKQVSVDPDVIVYYLQYLCYRQMGKQRHAEVAFNNLQWVVYGNNVICKETGLNILGHCFLERGQLHHALNCFVKSLRLESKFTVAPIHLALLIGKAIKHK